MGPPNLSILLIQTASNITKPDFFVKIQQKLHIFRMTFCCFSDIITLTGVDKMNWLRRMMAGRHGPDELSFAILVLFMICWVLSLFFPSSIWMILEIIVIFLCYFRMFSKNHYKRSQENAKFLHFFNPIRSKFRLTKKHFQERKTHKFFKCPNCKQEMRVPKGKGEVTVTCPKCKNKFDKRT